MSDLEVLALAAKEGRLLISHDQRTMPIHFANFIETETSAGVIIVLQSMPINKAIRGILKIWHEEDAEDWRDRIIYLPS